MDWVLKDDFSLFSRPNVEERKLGRLRNRFTHRQKEGGGVGGGGGREIPVVTSVNISQSHRAHIKMSNV